jgi:hypothetical protein
MAWRELLRPPKPHRAAGPPRTTSHPALRPVVAALGWSQRSAWRRITLQAVVLAAVGGVVMTGVGARQWWHVRGWPVEEAHVVDAVRTGDRERCGRHVYDDVYRLTWLSENAPAGLPSTFMNVEGCDAAAVGDTASIVRVVDDDGSVRVWDDPASDIGDVALLGLVGFVAALGVGYVAGLLRVGWRLLRRRGEAS